MTLITSITVFPPTLTQLPKKMIQFTPHDMVLINAIIFGIAFYAYGVSVDRKAQLLKQSSPKYDLVLDHIEVRKQHLRDLSKKVDLSPRKLMRTRLLHSLCENVARSYFMTRSVSSPRTMPRGWYDDSVKAELISFFRDVGVSDTNYVAETVMRVIDKKIKEGVTELQWKQTHFISAGAIDEKHPGYEVAEVISGHLEFLRNAKQG